VTEQQVNWIVLSASVLLFIGLALFAHYRGQP
jgi:hypothetical protein